jgi:hypothetical protein
MGDPGNPQQPGTEPGSEPDPDQAGWAAPTPPAPEPGPPPAPAPAPVPPAPQAAPPAAPQWGTPPPTWGTPPPGAPVPPQAAASGWQQPVGPAPKKRRLTWLWILIPVLIVLLGSTAVVGVYAARLAIEPIDASNEYLADLKAGRYDEAYRQLCTPARFAQTNVMFRDRQLALEDARGPITSYDISGIEFPDNNTSDVIDVITTGTVVRNGTTYDIRISLSREDGEWTVCSTSEH